MGAGDNARQVQSKKKSCIEKIVFDGYIRVAE